MISISVTVQAEEVLFRLDQIPKKLRAALHEKFGEIFSEVRVGLEQNTPGKYLDPKYIQSGVEDIGSLTIGFIEAEDKPGFYAIYPSKAKLLRFVSKSGELVFASKVENHPYLKGAPIVAEYLRQMKPWIESQLSDALDEARL